MGRITNMYDHEPRHPNRLLWVVLALLTLVVFGNFFLNH